ncbi:MAG: YqhA family protein [Bacteroidota bacterium]|nr:YqhA family protein [Bacteroidota bacterium]
MTYDQRKKVLRKLLMNINWFVLPAVFVLYISTAVLMLVGIFKLCQIFGEFYSEIKGSSTIDVNLIAAHFISIIDIYLLAIVFYIFAVAIYKLFIGEFQSLKWLKIENVDDLKSNIAKMTILFLSTFLVQKIAEWKDPNVILYFGFVITVVCVMLIVFIRMLKNHSNNDSNSSNNNEGKNNRFHP